MLREFPKIKQKWSLQLSQENETELVVMIPLEVYEELMDSAAFLEALQATGVDNWDGYDEAVEFYNELQKEITLQ